MQTSVSQESALADEVSRLQLLKAVRENSDRFAGTAVVGLYEGAFWSSLFFEQLLHGSRLEGEDLLFFVSRKGGVEEQGFTELEEAYFVRRRHGSSVSLPERNSPRIDWEASFFLNVLCHLEYSLVVTSRLEKEDGSAHEIVSKVGARVFGSPHVAPAAHSKDSQRSCYPLLCFQLHDYWNTGAVVISDTAPLLGVELLCRGALLGGECRLRLFSGALSLPQIAAGFARTQPWLASWTRGGSAAEGRESHVALKGPGGIGEASLVVVPNVDTKASPPHVAAGVMGWLKPAPKPVSFKCVVSHIMLNWEDCVRLMLDDQSK